MAVFILSLIILFHRRFRTGRQPSKLCRHRLTRTVHKFARRDRQISNPDKITLPIFENFYNLDVCGYFSIMGTVSQFFFLYSSIIGCFNDSIDISTVDMLTAGTYASVVIVEWALSLLLNHLEKLEKAKAENESIVGNDSLVDESDLSKLHYIQAIISETFRLFPAAPLLLPHESSYNCNIGGYDILRGTIVLVNAWSIHRDPMIWDDPTSFKLKRFVVGEVGPSKLLPFGMGMRSCPSVVLGQRVVGLALGFLIQCFEWQMIDEENVD
ncbi:Uncharacterized protein Fot_09916 [Forsythia ovata]|uniref:Cytochrome P450 n=1 Tax=Forsythia ovata TaxID=205694 RepID=A0ABD1WFC6_9LAMI